MKAVVSFSLGCCVQLLMLAVDGQWIGPVCSLFPVTLEEVTCGSGGFDSS